MLSDSECRAVFKAVNIYRDLLMDKGPAPIDRQWFNGERHFQRSRLETLLGKIGKQGRSFNQTSLTIEEKDYLQTGLEIAHIFYASARTLVEKMHPRTRYNWLKDIQNCIFKLN
jgi:hypothetical protein